MEKIKNNVKNRFYVFKDNKVRVNDIKDIEFLENGDHHIITRCGKEYYIRNTWLWIEIE